MSHEGPQAGTSGPHHCIATASTITDMIFRYLRARCTAQGGKLSFEDLEDANERFSASVPSGFDLFETIHLRCMRASGSTAPTLFARNAILATVLFEAGDQAAQIAFASQVSHYGTPWLRSFFHGLADYVRDAVCRDADYRLIAVYVQSAKTLKGRLSASELLKEADVLTVVRDCVGALVAADAPATTLEALREALNRHITKVRKSQEPDPSTVTQSELQRFLTLLRAEFAPAPAAAVA